MLKSRESTKAEREAKVREVGYPAYVTSAGWLGYDDEKVARLTKEAVSAGFNHFKVSLLQISHGLIFTRNLLCLDEGWL